MVYDSIAHASIPTAASNAKDFGKKKRVNRSAKLKQCKLDVRREQWLSQVKNKGCKDESNASGGVKIREPSVTKLEISPGDEGTKGSMNQYSDSESPSNSPFSHTGSVLESDISVANFTGSSCRSSSSSGSSSSVGCSGSMTEEDDGDNACFDDWEALADALEADDNKNDNHEPNLESPVHENTPQLDTPNESQPEPVMTTTVGQEGTPPNGQAWRPDDAFRPQTLPNLLKQNSFPINLQRHCACEGTTWGFKNVGPPPTTCPICCEDLDMTDSSFLPCPCGYRLCLFCYKRILEDNGRCPGCRKQYGQPGQADAPSKLGRSYSMFSRR